MTQPLDALAHEYWEWALSNNPTYATYLGDHRYDDRLPDVTQASLDLQDQALARFEQHLSAIPLRLETDRVTAELLRLKLQDQRDEIRHQFHQWALEPLAGPQVWLLELVNYHPQGTDRDLEHLNARYRGFAAYLQGYIDNLRQGVREGRTLPKGAHARVVGQLEAILRTPVAESPLRPQASTFSPHLLADTVRAITESVYPAFEALRAFLSDNYPARDAIGLGALPGGAEAYAYRIRSHTTTALTAAEIHDLGVAQIAAVEREMADIAHQVAGHSDVAAFRRSLRDGPQHCFNSCDELLETYRTTLARVESLLPRWFGRLPHSSCEVKAIEAYREKDCVAAFYYPPSEDFSRRGVFYVNTFEPEKRTRHTAAALTVHEAVPGHHLQIALAMEQTDLPAFWRHDFFTAYVEGWALYTERLADEMGVYTTPLDRFGMLIYQAWRSARLVVDTGMHALGWTRQQAVDYFEHHVGLPASETENEVDRYIMWPGQALAYSVGMHEILALRRLAEQRLGSGFDIRAFHDEILRHGALPLSVLRRLVERFVEQGQEVSPRS